MHYSRKEIEQLEQRYRTAFINTLSGFKTPFLVATKSITGNLNAAIFSSVTHIGANPPLLGIVSRPDSAERHTLQNIESTGYFTLNAVSSDIVKEAHQTSARYAEDINEFEACGLHIEYLDDFFSPYVKQSSVKMGMHLEEIIPVKKNGTKIIIGSIRHVYLPEQIVNMDGSISLHTINTLAVAGLDTYYLTQPLIKLSYAKPDKEPVALELYEKV